MPAAKDGGMENFMKKDSMEILEDKIENQQRNVSYDIKEYIIETA